MDKNQATGLFLISALLLVYLFFFSPKKTDDKVAGKTPAATTAAAKAVTAFEQGDYTASLQALAVLKAPVDAFFDGVMVNAEDAALRTNRLGLLASLHQAMNRVADLSRLAA